MNKNLKDRADALLQKIYQDGFIHGYNDGIKQLENYTQTPIGHWTHDDSRWKNRFICSICGYKLFDKPTNYCPECGARMDQSLPNETLSII